MGIWGTFHCGCEGFEWEGDEMREGGKPRIAPSRKGKGEEENKEDMEREVEGETAFRSTYTGGGVGRLAGTEAERMR